jgi:DNA-binding NarL/FixJ family response regulator
VVGRFLLLVDDDERTRRHLAQLLRGGGLFSHVAEAGCCSEAMGWIERSPPDWLITDLGLPDGSGVDLIRHLGQQQPAAVTLVISAFGDERSVIEALRAGASGYLLKDASAAEINRALRHLLEGGSPISPAVARYLLKLLPRDNEVKPSVAQALPEPLAEPLTQREREVLQLIADGDSYGEISQRLCISLNTVSSHIKHIYGKLAVRSRGKAIKAAERLGLLNGTAGEDG